MNPLDKTIRDYLDQIALRRAARQVNKILKAKGIKPKKASKYVKRHPLVTKICKHCGKEFETTIPEKVYCTSECRTEKWRKIQREIYTNGKKNLNHSI